MHATEETDYKQLLSFIMHDLRHINAMIRDSARLLGIATNLGNVDQDPPRQASRIDVESIRHHASIVLEQAAILSLWLAIADMYIEPERFAKEPMRLISLHEIFYKAIINFKRLAGKKNVKIKLNGQGKFQVNAHPVLEIMPYILLDNAVKYSPNSSNVEIDLDESATGLRVSVQSLGPKVEDEEIGLLFNRHFRGKYARQRSTVGSGQGLALLKTICDYHAATVKVASPAALVTLGGIPYGQFKMVIEIPRS